MKGKHADVNEIPGTVTKFIGMAEDKSLCDYAYDQQCTMWPEMKMRTNSLM